MTAEFVFLDVDAFPDTGDDQSYLVVPTGPSPGYTDNPKTVLLDPFGVGGREGAPAAAPPDTTLPVINNYVPAADTPIESGNSIQFDVTDDSGAFVRVIVTVTLAGIMEVVHDGAEFKGLYAATSGRSTIENGFRYVVARQGGWTATPTFETFAIDPSGNEGL